MPYSVVPPQVDIAGGINDLMQNYRQAQQNQQRQLLFQQQQAEYQKRQQATDLAQTAVQKMMSDPQFDSTKAIMGVAAISPEVGMQLSGVVKTLRGPQLTPDAILRHQDTEAGLRQKAQIAAEAAKPQSQRLYEWEFPQGQAPATAAQDGTAPQGKAPTPAEFVASQKVKQVNPEDIQGHYDTVNQQLTAMNSTIQDILKDPELDYVVGRGSMGARFSLPGSAYRTTASKLDQLENQAKLYGTVQLRESSKTGSSGFGRLTNTEFGTFGDLFANLRRGQDPETYRKNLIALSKHISDSQSRMKDRLDREIGGRSAGQDTGVPGLQTVNTPPPPGVVPAAASPKGMSDQQTINLARQLRQKGMNKDQIIQWFKARGVTIEP